MDILKIRKDINSPWQRIAVLKGDKGDKGEDGYTPVKGVDYFDGKKGDKGEQGPQGENGYTPIKGVDYFDGEKGDSGENGLTPTIGENGNWYLGNTDTNKPSRGIQGPKGEDGHTPVKGTDYFDGDKGEDGVTPTIGNNGNWYLGNTDTGKPSKGDRGDAGHTPVKGTDYWTAADKASIVDDVLAALPTWTEGSY